MGLLAQGRHVFLTGKAGTGKSTLIRRFMAQTDRNVVRRAAPTGIAALNVEGYTIHRAVRLQQHHQPRPTSPPAATTPAGLRHGH